MNAATSQCFNVSNSSDRQTINLMRKLVISVLFIGTLFTSCGQNRIETIQARAYYDSINFQINANRDLQQSLIDKATVAILTIKKDNTATIDTKSLQQLLDSAKKKNISRQHNIEKITEVDDDINYKGKVLDYVQHFNNFYDNEFKDFLVILNDKQQDRFTKGAALLMPKLKLIKEKEIEFKNAQEAFKSKYPVDEDGAIRTKPDYELVNFSEFKYKQADLKDGEEISLLSFSGGKDCEYETTYFKQFIGIVKSTGDTVRILSPCQTYDIHNPVQIGYYRRDITYATQNSDTKSYFIVFNKHQASLEKRNLKTTIGMLSFKE
jgi:hypothetical protein